jgi:importin subunit beta-1
LTGTSPQVAAEKKARWLNLDSNARNQVKGALLRLLCDRSPQVARAAAIVVAKMGELELSVKQWPELCSQLHDNVTNSNAQAGGDPALAAQTRRFTLNAMGYLCEHLFQANCDLDAPQMNKLLTAIIFCMDEKQSPAIRHAAMQALSESLPFATHNFGNQNERNVIMKKVCEASQMKGTDEDSVKTRRFAYICMTIVAQFYYRKEYFSFV